VFSITILNRSYGKNNKTIKPNYCINPPVNTYDDLKLTNYDPLKPILENNLPNNLCLTEKLRLLFIKYNMSYNICNSLLQVLKNESLNVPKDIRTLFKTPKFNDIVEWWVIYIFRFKKYATTYFSKK